MTPDQKALVQASFAKVAPIAEVAAGLFYEDLFRRDPKLKSLFKGDMTEQGRKLMAMLAAAVANLDRWEAIAEPVRALGLRHDGYGVKPADYDTVAASLIATLQKGLGEDFTPQVREAWIACYGAVAGEMQGAAAAS